MNHVEKAVEYYNNNFNGNIHVICHARNEEKLKKTVYFEVI